MQLYLRYNCTMTSTLNAVACKKNPGKWVFILSFTHRYYIVVKNFEKFFGYIIFAELLKNK
jgi:hypothetical protein